MSTTIDLGKLRFNWAGEWAVGTEYESNDLVRYGGDVFVYVYALAATGNLTTDTTYWSLVQEGLSWKGEYAAGTAYKPHEVVQHANNAYVCILLTTAGTAPPNATYWELLATGIKFEGQYAEATAAVNGTTSSTTALVVDTNVGTIAVGMVVTGSGISGTVTVSTVTDQNNLVLSSAQSLTDDVALSFDTEYQVDDVVYYGANTYICIQNSTGNIPTVTAYWNQFSHGMEHKGNWATTTAYKVDDVLSYGGQTYKALVGHTSGTFATDLAASKWVKFSGGMDWKGNWATSTAYKVNDIVNSSGSVYVASADHTSGTFSSDTAHWDTFANAGTVYATQTLTDGATVNWDHAFGNIALWTIADNRTMAAPTNLAVGSSALRLTQDGTGSRTVTWNAIFKWSAGAAPVLSTAANAVDVLAFIYDGTNIYGSLVSRGAA
tara:strand:- start:390 stop:1694 length:1305 start_codon:yes stop_codon:yes gene_type:complete